MIANRLINLVLETVVAFSIPDRWADLIFVTIKSILAFLIPFFALYLFSRLFSGFSTDFTKFISEAMKAEFRTDIGKINLIGMFIIAILLVILSGFNGDNTCTFKVFVFGIFFVVSLLIVGLSTEQRKEEEKDDTGNNA